MPSTIAEGDEHASSSMRDDSCRGLSCDEAAGGGGDPLHSASGRPPSRDAGASRRHVFQPQEDADEGERPYAPRAPGSGRRTPAGSAGACCSYETNRVSTDSGGALAASSSRESQLDSLGGSVLLPIWCAPGSVRAA